MTVTRPCGHTVTEWRFTHTPPLLSAILIRGGPLPNEPHELAIAEWMSGSMDSSEFHLSASGSGRVTTAAAYRLRYDAQARRLRGTRDGDSVWFAPLAVAEPRNCRDGITVPAPFDLSGSWSTGRGAAEPAAAMVMLHTECPYHPAAWVIQQTRDSIQAWTFPESFDQGIASKQPPQLHVPARGRVAGLDVTVQNETSHYRLRYDPASGHLRGTLNGVPFWAVRQSVMRPGFCPGIP